MIIKYVGDNMSVKTYNKGDITYLSNNFKAIEMDCKCSRCKQTLIDDDLIKGLQKIREHFCKALNITSGYRCPEHNKEVGGARASYHMKGMAADVYINGVSPKEIAQYAESTGLFKGIGRYSNFVHLDTRPNKYYWENLGNGEKAVQTHGNDTLKDDVISEDYVGRLKINDVNINVGLYGNNKQSTTDKIDSANYYTTGKGYIIADHNNQSFITLKNVKVGTVAKIDYKDGTTKEYKCVEVINGHNTGTDITDNNYNSLYGKHDIMCYTCKENWNNIIICMFDEIKNNEKNDFEKHIIYKEIANEIAQEVEKILIKHLSVLFEG